MEESNNRLNTSQLVSMIEKNKLDLKKELSLIKDEDLSTAVYLLKQSLKLKGRCPKCTLEIPCKHYKSVEEVEPSLFQNTRSQKYTPNRFFNLPKSHSPDPLRKNLIYGSRIRKLEAIERHKEEKLFQAIQNIEEMKKQAESDLIKKKKDDLRKRLYNEKLKAKIQSYHHNLKNRREELAESALLEKKLKLKRENDRKLYFLKQKERIAEYHKKRNLIAGIIEGRIEDLETHSLKKLKS